VYNDIIEKSFIKIARFLQNNLVNYCIQVTYTTTNGLVN